MSLSPNLSNEQKQQVYTLSTGHPLALAYLLQHLADASDNTEQQNILDTTGQYEGLVIDDDGNVNVYSNRDLNAPEPLRESTGNENPIDEVYQSRTALAARAEIGHEQTPVKTGSDKKVAILDRRLATEMAIFFSQPDRCTVVDERTPYLLRFVVGLFDQLLIENVNDGTLAMIIDQGKDLLDQMVSCVEPTDSHGNGDLEALVEKNRDLLLKDGEFCHTISQYERSKGSIRKKVSENVNYLQHTLQLAKRLNAVIIPHPDRWPLYHWWFEHCTWNTESSVSNEIVKLLPEDVSSTSLKFPQPGAQRGTKFSARLSKYAKLALAMHRYGPMAYPFLTGLTRDHDQDRLSGFEPFLYEFCAPVLISTTTKKIE
jgi:hypothetical protein